MGVVEQFGPDGPAMLRLGTAAVVGVAAALVIGLTAGAMYAPPAGWIVTAVIYLTWTWLLIRGMTAAQTKDHACRRHEEDATRRWSYAVMLLASIASLAGVGYLLMAQTSKSEDAAAAAVGVLSVAASWFSVHTVFMLRYARLFYSGDETGIDFNQREDPNSEPTYHDFAYLAFTIGMTYQVSDTNIRARNIRATALGHAMLSFLLGAIVLAVTINLVVGLTNYSS
ncbi:MAG TPA: DUF1345 domain-containing protein [Mycobacterium sp.]|nr:DUF1345 domain-containing protein [Mycobacterium sp.]